MRTPRTLFTRALAALALLCALSTSALAVDVTIAGSSFPAYNYPGATAKLRIYPSQTFTASDSVTVPGGTTPGSKTGFFFTVSCTVASNTLTCPSVTLKSTTDALDLRDTVYHVKLFDANDTPRDFFPLSDFALPHTVGSTTTWAVLRDYAIANTRPPVPGTLDADQTLAAIAANNTVGNPAKAATSPTPLGRVALSVTPADPALPIALGDNDTRVPTQGEKDALAGTAGTPSSSNRYVTKSDTRLTASSSNGRVAYASSRGAALNSNLLTGGGTDDTAVIQAALNLASTGTPLTLEVDGPALVGALNVYGNTTIRCTNGGGFFMKPATNRAMFRNAHPVASGTVTDKHIRIEGCTFNGNAVNQTGVGSFNRREADGTLIGLVQIYGADDVRVYNCTFINSKTIALHMGNVTNVDAGGLYFDNNLGAGGEQQGGFQIEGPSSKINVRGLSGNVWDDLFALGSDDCVYTEGIFTGLGPYNACGDITDVQVSQLNGQGNSLAAVRLFNPGASAHLIDRVIIDGVTGTFTSYVLWNEPGGLYNSTHGNIGTVTLKNVNVKMLNYTGVTALQGGIGLWNKVGHLILENINFNDPADNRGHLYLGQTADVAHLSVNGFRVYDTTDRSSTVMIYLDAGGRLRNGDFRDIGWYRGASHARAGQLMYINPGVTVDELFIDGLYANRVDNIIFRDTVTTTGRLTLRNVRHLSPTSSLNVAVSNPAGTISMLDMSGWYSDVAGRTYETGGTITAKRGDAFTTYGTCTLVAGACTVTYADAKAGTKVFVNRQADGGTVGASYSVTRSVGTSFTITSKDGAGATNTADTSVIAYEIRD